MSCNCDNEESSFIVRFIAGIAQLFTVIVFALLIVKFISSTEWGAELIRAIAKIAMTQ